ncbi:hypothetical protein NT07LI_3866, partial [Listeria innocua FSL S4-378]
SAFLAINRVDIPTPKSKPSRKKNPMNKMAINRNHNSFSDKAFIPLIKWIYGNLCFFWFVSVWSFFNFTYK